MSSCIDPATGLPFAVVPDALRAAYGFVDGCAAYYCAQAEQFVLAAGNESRQEPVVVLLTRDALYLGDEQGGIYRRVELTNICRLVANGDLPSVNDPERSRNPFTAFVLSGQQEPSDIVLAGRPGHVAALIALRLLSSRERAVPMHTCAVDGCHSLPQGAVRLPPPRTPVAGPQEQQALRESIPARGGADALPVGVCRGQFVATLARVADEERRATATSDGVATGMWVPVAVRRCFPPFKDVLLFWGGRVKFHGETLREASEAVLFVTAAQVVVVQEQQPVRVLPLHAISVILVHRIDGALRRRLTFLVSGLSDVEICVQTHVHDNERLLAQLHSALRAVDPTNLPPIRPITSTKGLRLRVRPRKGQKTPTVVLPPSSESVRYRNFVFDCVQDILRECEPSREHTAAALVEHYFGRELELLGLLYSTYPEYAVRQERRAGPKYRERLLAFCAKYLPDSVGIVDEVLYSYKTREEELFRRLVQRYGPEPREAPVPLERNRTTLTPEEVRRALVNFYRHYEPRKIADVDAIMALYREREQLLFDRLTQLYGPMPPDQDSASPPAQPALPPPPTSSHSAPSPPCEDEAVGRPSWLQRVEAFLARYVPERSGEAETLLQRFAGSEEALLYGLEKKYGPEPVIATRRNRARVAAFFVRAGLPEPDEAEIDEAIHSFCGGEEDFFFQLEQQYGAEKPLRFPPGPQDVTAAEFAKVDLRTEIPFVEVPEPLQPLFPSFCGRAALLWFGRVLHWEQPAAPTLRCAYLTSSHIYVGNSEADTARCAALELVEAVYINSRRERKDMPPCMLIRVQGEHDLFFAFACDDEGHQLLSALTSTLTQYHFGSRCRVIACASFTDPGIQVDCLRRPTHINRVAAVVRRPRTTSSVCIRDTNNNRAVHSNIDEYDVHALRLLKQQECEVRSRLHDALIVKYDEGQQVALQQDAALVNHRWDIIRPLATKQKEVFGTVPSRPVAGGGIASDAQPAMGHRPARLQGFQVVAGVPSHTDKLNPLQRAQYMKFSPNGTYGLGVKGSRCSGTPTGLTATPESSAARLLARFPEGPAANPAHEVSYRPSIIRDDGLVGE
ncbi:uncharacterized protein Tco025E_03297 [Trypanosoma conorhini]|uniref:Uncharacterized protein n=1 Tax=Trypanosoma conorhini TaxID=83891 RepID=A0A3R7PLC7_9TRYP|nr:uncharacterized protein Tco025E_03297 [Trypanosoma conorhini]RNF21702.1 hypothetical protein Tco025E_03297 [Trypanosoma conorhini]